MIEADGVNDPHDYSSIFAAHWRIAFAPVIQIGDFGALDVDRLSVVGAEYIGCRESYVRLWNALIERRARYAESPANAEIRAAYALAMANMNALVVDRQAKRRGPSRPQ